jgi:hypothetical protein
MVGRLKAMRRAGTNAPVGSAYNKAFGSWLDEHKWARELDKATRNHAIWAADNRNAIERWRETLAQNVRVRVNHPTTVKRAFEAAQKTAERSIAPGAHEETKAQKLEREIDQLRSENETLRERVDRDGSLFDLKRDSAKNIAHVIAGNIGLSKLTTLHKEPADEIARLKETQKHAG